MRHRLPAFSKAFLGASITVAATLSLPVGAQVPLEARAVFPPDGATRVPINAGVEVVVRGALFILPEQGLEAALLLQSENGDILAPANIEGQALDFSGSSVMPPASPPASYVGTTEDKGFALSTPPFLLQPGTHYRIRSRVAGCAEDETLLLCLDTSYQTIGEFDTGSELDRTPPTLQWDGNVAPGDLACEWRVTLRAEDPGTPPDAIRFVMQGGASHPDLQLGLGPVVTLYAPSSSKPDGTGPATVSVVAVDPSGNVGPAIPITMEACPLFDLSILGCDDGPECGETGDTSGCALVEPGVRQRSTPVLAVLGAALGIIARARRRRPSWAE
jgi:hypothetical protein